MKRGYFGIGVYRPKNNINIGTLWRSAYLFNANFIFTIGARYVKQPTDTIRAERHIPLFFYYDWEEFLMIKPKNCPVIIVEQKGRYLLNNFTHPERAIYVLGAEDDGVPEEYFKGNIVVEIPSNNISSLNVAVAGSIVMYDRFVKLL